MKMFIAVDLYLKNQTIILVHQNCENSEKVMDNYKYTQRKIYHFKNKINSCHKTEDLKQTSIQKKIHPSHKMKSSSRHSKSKKTRKWHALNHSNLKYANCASNYIGADRLTKQVGFLTKGKISDSISRLEKVVPENIRAQANQDLHRVLKSANESQSSLQSTSNEDDNLVTNCSPINVNYLEQSKSHYASSTKRSVNLKFTHSKVNSKIISTKSVLSPKLNSNVNQSNSTQSELTIPIQTIMNKFYPAVSHMNKLIFPGISNQEMLKTELLSLKRQYNCQKKSPSSSSNYESSQDVYRIEEVTSSDFQLNPVLTEEQTIPKFFQEKFELNPILTNNSAISHNLVSMFPEAENSSSSCGEEMQSVSSSASSEAAELASSQQKLNSSTERETKHVLMAYSPTSSNGSPVWEPIVSPIKFVPDCLPTPKIYFRQKMF